jgi:CBS-domain-containing membrane protein
MPGFHQDRAQRNKGRRYPASRRGERATSVSLQPRITDADLQAVVNETYEVYDIDADDLRDRLSGPRRGSAR